MEAKMVEANKEGLVMRERLKSLCGDYGWSYALFWRFDQKNSMLLRAEDVYCEEQMQAVIDCMLQQVHVLGEGLVGQVASSRTHQWILSDVDCGANSVSSTLKQGIFQENSEIFRHFLCGVKTIALIFVESQGVLQLGSSQKVSESMEFLDQMKKLFKEMEDSGLASPVHPSASLNCENYDLNEWFASFCNENITPMHGGSSNDLMEIACSSINLTQPCAFTSEFQQEGITASSLDSSHPSDQLHSLASEAQVIASGKFGIQLPQITEQTASSVDNSAGKTPCISTLSNEDSVLTSLRSQWQCDLGFCDSSQLLPTKTNYPETCSNKKQNFQDDSTLTSFDNSCGFINSGRTSREIPENFFSNFSASLNSMSERELAGKISQVLHEKLKPDVLLADRSNTYALDNLFEGFRPSGECSASETDVSYHHLQSVGVSSVSSGMVGHVSAGIPFEQPSQSVQSSITETYVCGEQTTINHSQDDILEGGLEFLSSLTGTCLENMTIPVVSGGHLASSTGVSQSITDMNISPIGAPRRALFSELGLEDLLNGITSSNYISNASTDHQLSATKRQRVESSPVDGNQVHLSSLSCSGSSIKIPCNIEKSKDLPSKPEGLLNWIDDRYSISNGNTGQAKTKKPEETTKTARKRARPGESTRPRPKDRQQIQDRLKELKGIIPGGEKCSIDALLDRTIKHMLFLQSVTKYADKLKQANESKDNIMLLKDNSTKNGGSRGGATWALEVGDQTAVCPIRIEDISSSGLMLIEMLCDDRGFFLELADIIRSFGLNILKGVMEIQEDKILARFIVEAHTHMTRIEIFWSLVELIQQTTNSGMESKNQPSNPMHVKDPLLNNYPQHCFANPIGLAEALQ